MILIGHWINFNQVGTLLCQFTFVFQIIIGFVTSCPELCSSCLSTDLSCEKFGLLEIPFIKSFIPQKVVLANQQFSNPVLGSSNFSNYRAITDLSIRSCNINRIRPYALSGLIQLRFVDFSDNTELLIENNSFSGLNLQFLKLDNLGIIRLDLHAFNGLKVESLSIQNSNLLTLPFELVNPIANSLTKLFLKNNQLRSLDMRLRPVLLGLKLLELQDNPFICNCSLLWLSEILESKRQNYKQSLFENQEDLYPRCVAPPELRKEYVYMLVTKLKNCAPPTIVQIDVVFHSLTSVGLHCNTKEQESGNEVTEVGWFFSDNTTKLPGIWKNSIQVPLTKTVSKYKCKAQNSMGNSEIYLLLIWNESVNKNVLHTNKTLKFNNSPKKSGFLWEKVFSLFEMMCAIFGTLVITVILFFLLCCCYVERSQFLLINKNKRKLQKKNYPSYERGIYSDTRIYCETDMDVCPFPPPPPPTPPPLPETRLIHKSIFQSM